MSKRKPPRAKGNKDFIDHAAKYLKDNGWLPIVIGGTGVRQDPSSHLKFNYELVVRFTGKKIEP